MKVRVCGSYACPSCDLPMTNFNDKKTMGCTNAECEMSARDFEVPLFDIKEIPDIEPWPSEEEASSHAKRES